MSDTIILIWGVCMKWVWRCCLLLGWALLSACSRTEAPPKIEYADTPPVVDNPVYTLAIHPLYSPGSLFEKFEPVVRYVNQRVKGFSLRLEASRNYAAYDDKIRAKKPDFLLPNPFQTLIGLHHGYHVIGKVADDENFRGIILVRRDGNIRAVTDLRGGEIAAPGPTALAATMMPKYYLATHGLDVHKDVRWRYTGSQESTIMSLYLGEVRAATTWPVPWKLMQRTRPEVAARLKLAWQTNTLPSNSVMAHERVPASVAEQVIRVLVAMADDPEGKRLLAASTFLRFERADDETYTPVRRFIEAYSRTVEEVSVD